MRWRIRPDSGAALLPEVQRWKDNPRARWVAARSEISQALNVLDKETVPHRMPSVPIDMKAHSAGH